MRHHDPSTLCKCGHPFVAHEHLRRGTDCVLCQRGSCVVFRRERPGRSTILVDWLRGGSPSAGDFD